MGVANSEVCETYNFKTFLIWMLQIKQTVRDGQSGLTVIMSKIDEIEDIVTEFVDNVLKRPTCFRFL